MYCIIIDTEPVITTYDAQFNQFLRLLNRQTAKTYGIEELKDCGVGAYAERQRDDGYGGEAGAAGKSADGIVHIAEKTFDTESRVLRLDALFQHFRIAEPQTGGAGCLLRAHSFGNVGVDAHL